MTDVIKAMSSASLLERMSAAARAMLEHKALQVPVSLVVVDSDLDACVIHVGALAAHEAGDVSVALVPVSDGAHGRLLVDGARLEVRGVVARLEPATPGQAECLYLAPKCPEEHAVALVAVPPVNVADDIACTAVQVHTACAANATCRELGSLLGRPERVEWDWLEAPCAHRVEHKPHLHRERWQQQVDVVGLVAAHADTLRSGYPILRRHGDEHV